MAEETLHQPSDKLFKTIFKNPAQAIGLLSRYLPPSLAACIDWTSALLQPGSYVDERFKAAESDLLYRVKLRGVDAFLFILFEHQRQHDPWLALRLLGYMVRIWEDYRKAHPHTCSLPLIIPVVLVQNDKTWNLSPKFSSLFDFDAHVIDECRDFIPDFTMRLIELASIPFDQIKGTALGIMALRVLKAERAKDLLNDQVWDEQLLGQVPASDLRLLLLYIFHAGVDKTAFRHRLEKIVHPQIRQQTMSLAEQIKQEGQHEGQILAFHRAVIEVLEIRFERVPEGLREEIARICDPDRLTSLHREAIRAAGIEDFTKAL